MEPAHVARLQAELEKSVHITQGKIASWHKFRDDYTALKDRLTTLPDQVSHDVMVPFTSVGFMPGQLIHTNEILVLLGDNWFAEQSAKQAVDIVDRRIAAVENSLAEFQEELKLLERRRHFTKDVAQEEMTHHEIREVYDEEKEKKWREEHRKKVQQYHKEKRKSAEQQDIRDEEDLWARLDELELQEARNNELARLSEEENNDSVVTETATLTDKTRTIKWEDEENVHLAGINSESEGSSSEERTDEETESDDEASEVQINSPGRTIFFKHTTKKLETIESFTPSAHNQKEKEDTENAENGTPKKKINSPRDIYLQFAPSYSKSEQPKPILKTRSHGQSQDLSGQVEPLPRSGQGLVSERSAQNRPGLESKTVGHETEALISEGKVKMTSPSDSKAAFTGSVVERTSTGAASTTDVQNPVTAPPSGKSEQPQKRISKFKARRLQQENQ